VLRVFIAVDLPAELKQTVASLHTDLRGARWAKPHQLHITLRFMGDTPDEALPTLRERLARVEAPAFELALRGLGVFPPGAGKPRVLWLGITPTDPLVALERKIDTALASAVSPGPEPEREFSPHLTLARLDGKPDAGLPRLLAQNADFQSHPWKVEAFHLYKSTLHKAGAVHEALFTYSLGTIRR
jgi:2'-5' RNA ligase